MENLPEITNKQQEIIRPRVLQTAKAPVNFELYKPEEGCGLSRAAHNRIVNGYVAKNGMLT